MSAETAADTAPPGEPIRMKFLLRSGNAFMVDGVLNWDMEKNAVSGRIVSLKLTQSQDPRYARAIVETIDLAQIEAVLILPPYGPGRRANDKEDGRG